MQNYRNPGKGDLLDLTEDWTGLKIGVQATQFWRFDLDLWDQTSLKCPGTELLVEDRLSRPLVPDLHKLPA